MKKKYLIISLILSCLLFSCGKKYNNEFVEKDGKIYFYDENGKKIQNKIYLFENENYCFDENGEMLKSKWKLAGDKKMYFDNNGRMIKGKNATINGEQYFFDMSGKCLTNTWKEFSGKRLYLGENGKAIKSQIKEINGTEYQFDEKGFMLTGIIKTNDGERLYSKKGFVIEGDGWIEGENGRKAFLVNDVPKTGWNNIDGKDYYFDYDGYFVIDSFVENKYYVDEKGEKVRNKWIKNNDDYYYIGNNGEKEVSKWKNDNGQIYYLDLDGKMIRNGFNKINNNEEYYFEKNGALAKNKWVEIENERYYKADSEYYYINNEGRKTIDKILEIDGAKYGFNKNGIMVKGWNMFNKKWYCFGKDGKMFKNTLIDNDYYVGLDGVMAANETRTINGKLYTFASDGKITKVEEKEITWEDLSQAEKNKITKDSLDFLRKSVYKGNFASVLGDNHAICAYYKGELMDKNDFASASLLKSYAENFYRIAYSCYKSSFYSYDRDEASTAMAFAKRYINDANAFLGY